MEQSTMDKKNLPRGSAVACKNGQELQSKDFPVKKNRQGFNGRAAKKDHDKVDFKKQGPARGGRGVERFPRTREKAQSGQVKPELGSLYDGRKKQNITHLMDWWGPNPIRHQKNWTSNKSGVRHKWNTAVYHKHNKEHYIQANCQFIVLTGEDYSLHEYDPDTLVQWNHVQEVRLHVSEISSCPICLHPPIAAKVTRCGHVYCYSCILHYLALTDDNWRKCPICDAEIVNDDLKSAMYVISKDYLLGEEISLQLMKREKGSLVPIPVNENNPNLTHVSELGTSYDDLSPYSKLFTATHDDICNYIIAREERELKMQLAEEGDQPESCFIADALQQLEIRRNGFMSLDSQLSNLSLSSSPNKGVGNKKDPNGNKMMKPSDLKTPPNKSPSVDELDVSQLQLYQQQQPEANKNPANTPYYFYQAIDGVHVYLHTFNRQMLVHEYGSLEKCPPIIKGRIIEKETASMTSEIKNSLRFLSHLPVTCPFEFVEIELHPGLVSKKTLTNFQDKIENRKKKRNKKVKEEKKIERRVKAEEDKMMGRTPGMRLSIQSSRHFPSFADEPTSISASDFEVDPNFCTSPPKSVEIDPGVPSFAQMIREQPVVKAQSAWPSLGEKSSPPTTGWINLDNHVKPSTHARRTRTRVSSECSDGSENNFAAAPQYKQTYSDAFSLAFDAATKKAQEKQDTPGSKDKKKKRNKGIVLFSSGGF